MRSQRSAELEECRISLQNSGLDCLFLVLRQGIYHLTGVRGYRGIRQDGLIKSNDGSFPNTYPQSVNGYGRRRGYVSLFDFESPTEEQCLLQHWKWEGFFTKHKPATILLGFDRGQLEPKLVSYERATEEVGFAEMKIPHIETWCIEPIPFSYATSLVLVNPVNPKDFRVFGSNDAGLQAFECALREAEKLNTQEEKNSTSSLAAWLHSNRSAENINRPGGRP